MWKMLFVETTRLKMALSHYMYVQSLYLVPVSLLIVEVSNSRGFEFLLQLNSFYVVNMSCRCLIFICILLLNLYVPYFEMKIKICHSEQQFIILDMTCLLSYWTMQIPCQSGLHLAVKCLLPSWFCTLDQIGKGCPIIWQPKMLQQIPL